MTLSRYLKENYYDKINHPVTEDQMIKMIDLNKDKIIVVMEGEEIKGVAIFLTLTDETYARLDTLNFNKIEELSWLLAEKGNNLHFIVVVGSGIGTILKGIRKTKLLKPKTISWFNPTMTKLHKYNLN